MPYGKGEVPAAVKNLPAGAQAIYRRVFNSVYEKTKDEDQARQAAWAQVKRKYRKVSEGKWVPLYDRSEIALAEEAITALDNGLFKKRILYQGRFLHPSNPDRFFDVTPEHFADIVRNFKDKVFDKVQMYWTHREDPRDIGGEVVRVETGVEASDGKQSLYAILKPHDEAAREKMAKNQVAVSAALDNVYREHLEGKPTGTVLRHVALVGEGWIKKLGEFVPLRLAESEVFLSENKEGAVFIGAREDDKKVPEHKHTKADLEEGEDSMPELKDMKVEDILAHLKSDRHIDVAALQEAAKNAPLVAAARSTLGLSDSVDLTEGIRAKLKEADGKVEAAEKRATEAEAKIVEAEANTAVDALLSDGRIKPADKEAFKKLFLKDKDVFTAVTGTLKKGGAVPLGEKGHTESDDPADAEKALEEGTAIFAEAGIPMKGYDKNGKKKEGDK